MAASRLSVWYSSRQPEIQNSGHERPPAPLDRTRKEAGKEERQAMPTFLNPFPLALSVAPPPHVVLLFFCYVDEPH